MAKCPEMDGQIEENCFIDVKFEPQSDIDDDKNEDVDPVDVDQEVGNVDLAGSTSAGAATATATAAATITTAANHDDDDDDDIRVSRARDIPICWNEYQCENFKAVNKWLVVKKGKLGCKVCMNVCANEQRLQTQRGATERGNRLPSLRWRTCQISHGGKTLETQQSSLRKKIFEHKNSRAHIEAMLLEENIGKMMAYEELSKLKACLKDGTAASLFRSVYRIVKERIPLSGFDVAHLIRTLQTESGFTLDAEKLFFEILSQIAANMRQLMVNELLAKAKKISVVMHECSAANKTTMLTVHLKAHFEQDVVDVPDPLGDDFAGTLFLDLINQNSASNPVKVAMSFLQCLAENNISKEYLKENLIGFTFDEYSPILGRNSLVQHVLRRLFPNAKVEYDLNHRLETAIHNLYKKIRGLKTRALENTVFLSDAFLVNVVGPPPDQFDPTGIVKHWLHNRDGSSSRTNFLPQTKEEPSSSTASTSDKKISNDLALTSEAHDDERLVIDLKSEATPQDTDTDEPSFDQPPETNSHVSDEKDFKNDVCGNAKRKKRSWRQTEPDSELIERLIQRVKEATDSHPANEDKDRMFLLSLLPFVKQLNTQENLEFRTEVQQILQKKLHAKSTHVCNDRDYV